MGTRRRGSPWGVTALRGGRARASSDVELIEEGSAEPAILMSFDAPAPPSAAPPRMTVRHHVLLWGSLVLIAVLGGVLVVGQHQEVQRRERLAGTSGLVASLEDPLQEIWRTGATAPDGVAVSRWGPVYSAGGVLVAVAIVGSGEAVAIGFDPTTGVARWTTSLSSPAVSTTMPTCRVLEPADAVTCLASERLVAATPALDGSAPESAVLSGRLVTVDAATGTVLHERHVTVGAPFATLGPDIVVVQVDRGGLSVTRLDPRTGAERWTSGLALAGASGLVTARMSTMAGTGLVLVSTTDQAWEISSDGAVLNEQRLGVVGDTQSFHVASDGRIVLWSLRLSSGDSHGQVLSPGSGTVLEGRSITVHGFPLEAVVDDGSAPELVLSGSLGDDRLFGADLTTGRQRWASGLALRGDPTVLDGQVVVSAVDGLHLLDGQTGAVAWSTSTPAASDGAFVTDGSAVAVLESSPGGRPGVIRAYGLADGQRWWSSAVDGSLVSISQSGGRVYGRTGQDIIAFG